MTQQNSGLILTVKKVMDIMDCLGKADAPLSASEAGRRLGISRSTAYRLLTTFFRASPWRPSAFPAWPFA
ncbi:MAG: helix-turn-helix domain-containing protein [Chloroflexota bacterium]